MYGNDSTARILAGQNGYNEATDPQEGDEVTIEGYAPAELVLDVIDSRGFAEENVLGSLE